MSAVRTSGFGSIRVLRVPAEGFTARLHAGSGADCCAHAGGHSAHLVVCPPPEAPVQPGALITNQRGCCCCCAQTPTFNSTLAGRVLLDLFSEPDIFGIKWDALTQYNGAIYPALPDLYGPTMNVRRALPPLPMLLGVPSIWMLPPVPCVRDASALLNIHRDLHASVGCISYHSPGPRACRVSFKPRSCWGAGGSLSHIAASCSLSIKCPAVLPQDPKT